MLWNHPEIVQKHHLVTVGLHTSMARVSFGLGGILQIESARDDSDPLCRPLTECSETPEGRISSQPVSFPQQNELTKTRVDLLVRVHFIKENTQLTSGLIVFHTA